LWKKQKIYKKKCIFHPLYGAVIKSLRCPLYGTSTNIRRKLFAKYIEIYTTLDMEKYFRVKNLLAENNISYKDTSTNNQLRLSLNNLRGDNPVLLRDSSIKNTYSISVKKEDEQKARQIIQNTTGTSFSK